MAGKIILNVPEDPKLTLSVSIENGKSKFASHCSFCGEPLSKREMNFVSEVRGDVAICHPCIWNCFNQANHAAFAPMDAYLKTATTPEEVLDRLIEQRDRERVESDPFWLSKVSDESMGKAHERAGEENDEPMMQPEPPDVDEDPF